MYIVKPKGINTRQTERDVADGFLQESINLQWRDGAYRPIPERLPSGILKGNNVQEIILHKVDDEDNINVLKFFNGYLYWYGTISNGIYDEFLVPISIADVPRTTDFNSLSFTILNSVLYLMNSKDGFYYSVQFNEPNQDYEAKDMYAWKSLIPYFPYQEDVLFQQDSTATQLFQFNRCGMTLIRFALVLKTGEVVLHSPCYPYYIYGLDFSEENTLGNGDVIKNIHTFINMNMEYNNMAIFEDTVSAINIYSTIPTYYTEYTKVNSGITGLEFGDADVKGETQKLAESPFYLIKTIEEPSDERILLSVGDMEFIPSGIEYSKVNIETVAAGEVMPVDNFSYHKLFGVLSSENGRIIVNSPKTILSRGYIKSLAYLDGACEQGFEISTEDGSLKGLTYSVDKTMEFSTDFTYYRGLLSYPDAQATYVGSGDFSGVRLFKSRANNAHNMACVFDFKFLSNPRESSVYDSGNARWDLELSYSTGLIYGNPSKTEPLSPTEVDVFYSSENRFQFSEAGEFTVWPAINSYRVGGKIMFVGSNSVDPANMDYLAPLLIGTTDGVYTVNFDVTGATLIQSITKAANMPALSKENISIDQNLIYVSDKGLISINSGQLLNLTSDFFPDHGGSVFNSDILPNYELLTFFGENNPYQLGDIVEYMKGAKFAYDGRRNNLWCCNSEKGFSLVFNLVTKQWDVSTYVFSQVVDLFGLMNTTQEGEIYSRYLTLNMNDGYDILSGEDSLTEVDTHLLTRAIKIQTPDQYKKIQRLISRCELYKSTEDANFTLGIWGKQDLNITKQQLPLVAIKDDKFINDVRQDIPIGRQKGKYKVLTILQGGKILPSSSLNGFEIVAIPVDNNILR